MSRTSMLMLKQANGQSGRKHTGKTADRFPASRLNQNRRSLTPSSSPILQEMFTFVAHDDSKSCRTSDNAGADGGDPFCESHQRDTPSHPSKHTTPTTTIPPMEASSKRRRLKPLTIEEYETKLRTSATDSELIDRVFAGSIACNQLRAALWPYLFGLILHRGRFDKVCDPTSRQDGWLFVEHEANKSRWCELNKLYDAYQAQWRNILPEQEARFTMFRERKSMIERDVVRCDRLHPFYAEQPQNLAKLTNLLMTYMMYDFDIGYVQGMSDLAGPILYLYKGDLAKAFWVFVEVMKLFRRNFELTQKTIQFQLSCLFELIRSTDPIFAQYLQDNESSNCFFAFRAIVCQFKRELMKEDGDDYSKVLFLWDTIWCVARRCSLYDEMKELTMNGHSTTNGTHKYNNKQLRNGQLGSLKQQTNGARTRTNDSTDNLFAISIDQNQANSPRYKLFETEIFVLALCLSMIRRERDLIMARKLDSTDIHLHFIDPKLTSDLNGFIEHATNIYLYLKNNFDLRQITSPKRQQQQHAREPSFPIESYNGATIAEFGTSPLSVDGYDFLSDFLIINGVSGT